MHSCCAGLENHVVVGGEGAHVCLTCGHGYAETAAVAPVIAVVAATLAAGYLVWQAAKMLRRRATPTTA